MSFRFTGKWQIQADKIIALYRDVIKAQPKGSHLRESMFVSCLLDLQHLHTNMSMEQGELKYIPITILPRKGQLNYQTRG